MVFGSFSRAHGIYEPCMLETQIGFSFHSKQSLEGDASTAFLADGWGLYKRYCLDYGWIPRRKDEVRKRFWLNPWSLYSVTSLSLYIFTILCIIFQLKLLRTRKIFKLTWREEYFLLLSLIAKTDNRLRLGRFVELIVSFIWIIFFISRNLFVSSVGKPEFATYCLLQLSSGMQDTHDEVVSASLHAMARLVTIIGGPAVTGLVHKKMFADGTPKVNLSITCIFFWKFQGFFLLIHSKCSFISFVAVNISLVTLFQKSGIYSCERQYESQPATDATNGLVKNYFSDLQFTMKSKLILSKPKILIVGSISNFYLHHLNTQALLGSTFFPIN